MFEESARDTGISWLASFPGDVVERLILLLESGFAPKTCHQLANELKMYIQLWTCQLRTKLKIRLPKSTMVFGIADPTGALKPGEVYLGFSESFRDETTGESWPFLNGEVLVARHPSLRRSDIQKVKAIYKEELSHLRDVVVFPVQGTFPLAGKLQGGDYDGDTFWVTWEPRLTLPFENAPAPTSTPLPEKFGIKVDKRKLRDVLGNHRDVDAWLQQSFAFKLQEDLLGQVTNFHKRLAYQENSISGCNVNDVVDLHDLIIDSAKNGYTFAADSFIKFKKDRGILEPGIPAYEALLTLHKNGNAARDKPSIPRHNSAHIIDVVLFEIVNPRLEAMQAELGKKLEPANSYDLDLVKLYLDVQAHHDPVIDEVLTSLAKELYHITNCWNTTMNSDKDFNNDRAKERFQACKTKCYEDYAAISPCRTDHPLIDSWRKPRLCHEPTTWDLLKASTFYHERHQRSERFIRSRSPSLVFFVAGRELCYLKAMSRAEGRTIVKDLYAMMTPRKENDKKARLAKE